MNVSRLLCPIDFSDASTHAIEHAVLVARHYHSQLAGLHVVTPLAMGFVGPGEEPDRFELLREAAEAEFKAAAAARIPLTVFVERGEPAVTILQRASALPADLIVMGTHGKSGFQHLVLGSVTEKVLRKASCPVLTVPARAQATSQLPFRRIVCGVDFSDASIKAAQSAASLARESAAALTLLYVLEWPWPEPGPTLAGVPDEQRKALDEFRRYEHESAKKRLDSLLPAELSPVTMSTRISDGKPHAEILRVAAEEQADLIVIGVHGRNPVDLALFGSTANQIVRRATCPVLTTRF